MSGTTRLAVLASLLVLARAGDWCVPECDCSEDDVGIRLADCSRRHLINVDSDMLGGELFVQGLDLSHNALAELTANFPDNVKGRWRLMVLSLANNAIASLSSDALRGFTSLRVLDLSDNRISALPPGFLHTVPSLHALSLEGNRLYPEQGEGGWFVDAPHLKKLSLARCNFGHLSDVALSRLPSLVMLDLSGNQLNELPAQLPPILRRLELDDNPLRCSDSRVKQVLATVDHVQSPCFTFAHDSNQPRRSEAIQAYDSHQSALPAVFAGLLCEPVDGNSSSVEFTEFEGEFSEEDHHVTTDPLHHNPRIPHDWLHLWGMPAMWAAMAGMITGIMLSAWVVWCWHQVCSCNRQATPAPLTLSDSYTTLLLNGCESSPSLNEDSTAPPGTPPPPYLLSIERRDFLM